MTALSSKLRLKIVPTYGMATTDYRVNAGATLRLSYLGIWHQPSGANGIGDGSKRLITGECRP
jgi:hypothetical protein